MGGGGEIRAQRGGRVPKGATALGVQKGYKAGKIRSGRGGKVIR